MANLLSIKLTIVCVYVIDNGNNETRDVSRDEKKLIEFTFVPGALIKSITWY